MKKKDIKPIYKHMITFWGLSKKSEIYDYIQLGLKNKLAEKYHFRLNH